jgi:uncharacterized membrane protein HdeD (DUF308 family)
MQDLRIPIGAFFLILGVILVATPSTGAPLTEAPVNLYTGAFALLFGGGMIGLAWRYRA